MIIWINIIIHTITIKMKPFDAKDNRYSDSVELRSR